MLVENGEELLQKFAETAYPYEIHRINERILHVVGLGHSNVTVIEGHHSLILIDTLDTDERAEILKERLKEYTDKEVETIIFTHGHPDHRGGSGAFESTVKEVIAFTAKKPMLKYYERLNDVLNQRGEYQHGYLLNDHEAICQGIGKREGFTQNEGKYHFLNPTTLYNDECVERVIDGVKIKLVSAPGETDDQIFVWLDTEKVLCCGDNYYGCFPNLYAIRGTQYRDVATWIDSLELILSYHPQYVLTGHTKALIGETQINEVLGNYKETLEYILLNTLDYMNQGMSESEVVEKLQLPSHLSQLSYLGEFYGTLEWSVRSIYNGYLGWFDGNPTHLHPLPEHIFNSKLVSLIGQDKLVLEVQNAMNTKQYQLALQYCDMLIHSGYPAQELKKKALLAIARWETSANGRHYYLSCAKEQERE